jgi:hypothetical protein
MNKELLRFHRNNDYANALQGCIIHVRTVSCLSCSVANSRQQLGWRRVLSAKMLSNFQRFPMCQQIRGVMSLALTIDIEGKTVLCKSRYLLPLFSLLVDWVGWWLTVRPHRFTPEEGTHWMRGCVGSIARLDILENRKEGFLLVPGIKLGFDGPSVPRYTIICLKDNGRQKSASRD